VTPDEFQGSENSLTGKTDIRYHHLCGLVFVSCHHIEGIDMAKGQQQQKQTKKKPAKTLEEKRAAKREKKANRR
jgi:hypothetical protein